MAGELPSRRLQSSYLPERRQALGEDVDELREQRTYARDEQLLDLRGQLETRDGRVVPGLLPHAAATAVPPIAVICARIPLTLTPAWTRPVDPVNGPC